MRVGGDGASLAAAEELDAGATVSARSFLRCAFSSKLGAHLRSWTWKTSSRVGSGFAASANGTKSRARRNATAHRGTG